MWKFSWVVGRSNHTWLIHVAWVLNDLAVEFCKGMSQEQKFQDTKTSYDPDLGVILSVPPHSAG